MATEPSARLTTMSDCRSTSGSFASCLLGFGYLSKTRLALKGFLGLGFPDNVPYFRLGGGTRLRALDLNQYLGSSVWIGSAEWRFPIWEGADIEAFDHVVKGKNVNGSVFYDFGQSYLNGNFSPFISGVGVGLGVDVALFSFLERANIRVLTSPSRWA